MDESDHDPVRAGARGVHEQGHRKSDREDQNECPDELGYVCSRRALLYHLIPPVAWAGARGSLHANARESVPLVPGSHVYCARRRANSSRTLWGRPHIGTTSTRPSRTPETAISPVNPA